MIKVQNKFNLRKGETKIIIYIQQKNMNILYGYGHDCKWQVTSAATSTPVIYEKNPIVQNTNFCGMQDSLSKTFHQKIVH